MNRSNSDIGTFKTIVKQFEESKKFINKEKAEYSRMAIVLIDNIIEILLFNHLNEVIEADKEIMFYREPSFSIEEINGINRYFEKKIKAIKKLGIIESKDAAVFNIIHSYRNSIYHRDYHNPITVNKFAQLYFVVATDLFEKIFDNGTSIWGKLREDWLKKYGLRNDRVDFKEASNKIKNNLVSGFNVTMPVVKDTLSEDIIFRLKKIEFIRGVELSWLENDIIFDGHLKVAEYFDKNPYFKSSKDYNSLLYEFFSHNYSLENVDAQKKWMKIKLEEQKRDNKIGEDLKDFKQTIKSGILKNAKEFLKTIDNFKKIDKLLERYNFIDRNFLKVELYLNQFSIEFDREVQLDIDIARGK
jgi:hypothetical protein